MYVANLLEKPMVSASGESIELMLILENEIIPAFYNRDENGIPKEWIKRIRYSIATITYFFNTNRMVREYAEKYYKYPVFAY